LRQLTFLLHCAFTILISRSLLRSRNHAQRFFKIMRIDFANYVQIARTVLRLYLPIKLYKKICHISLLQVSSSAQ